MRITDRRTRKYMQLLVDANLSTDLLDKFNNLKGIELVSICIGHTRNRKPYEYPHLTLKISGDDAIKKTAQLVKVLYQDPDIKLGSSYMKTHWEIYRNEQCVWPDFPFESIPYYTFLRIEKETKQSKELTHKWFEKILKIIKKGK